MLNRNQSRMLVAIIVLETVGFAAAADAPDGSTAPLERSVELNVGESQDVKLADGSTARIKLVALKESSDLLRNAVREARVTVEVNGASVDLVSGTYNLPVTAAGVQIDCPITRGYTLNTRTISVSRLNAWGLGKDARFRLWPAGSPWMEPGSFRYPLRQRWFASDTQMSNEPSFVDGAELIRKGTIYYHYALDIGGAEGLVEVLAAVDGLVVSAADKMLDGYDDTPARHRYDGIVITDARDWYCAYYHLKTIDVKPGDRVRQGQRLGLLGKEGTSGGWSHLHFQITSRQPSGDWGIHDAYAYVWEAYLREQRPQLVAVARPHHLAAVGQTVELDSSKSWSAVGNISRFEWTFTDGTRAIGARVERSYSKPGTYSEIVRVTDDQGRSSTDFAIVQVLDPQRPKEPPPTIHAAYYPTDGIRPGDPVTFKVRTFRTTEGEELWNFGDGSPPVRVHSDGAVKHLAPDGYAITEHRYDKPGFYVARVERSNDRGETAVAHLLIEVQPAK